MKKETLAIYEELFIAYPKLEVCKQQIMDAFDLIKRAYDDDLMLLACGNGGSASDAEHIVGELMKSFKMKRPLGPVYGLDDNISNALSYGLPAVCLSSHTSLLTAIANDASYNMIYAQQVYAFRKMAGVLLCLSTSGNADNVNYAAMTARAVDIPVIGMSGQNGGRLATIADVCIKVPESETYKVQEYHLPVYHALCAMIERELFEY